jgi:type IV pilus assembly protein PilB
MLKDVFSSSQKQVGEALITKGLVTETEYEEAMDNAPAGTSEVKALVDAFSGRKDVLKEIAEACKTRMVPLLELGKVPSDVINSIPRQLVTDNKIFPISFEEDDTHTIVIATADPTDLDLFESLELRTNKNIKPVLGTPIEIEKMISKYYGDAAALEAANALASTYQDVDVNRIDLTAGDSPIITIVNSILEQAARMKTSDIHIEPFEDKLRIRYRVDGALTERPAFPMALHAAIISRLKIMGGMDIAEKRIPQDGRITFMVDKVEYDIRVSMLPTVYGEKCVMRLAIRENLQRDKKDLGLSEYDLKIFNKVFSNPNGIILVTGPTGSGKSTTLYTASNELSTEEVNVITVEDPVEANVPGVNQVQTNVRAGLTFASALRSILRQDPDIIMIGEIRDTETAAIAVQASITGHLVVSTLHTNDTASSVTRLLDMGVESYLIADSVVGIIAQRLVRRLCPHCKRERQITAHEAEYLGVTDIDTIYEPAGCQRCGNTGYYGRIGVYEVMEISPHLVELIARKAPADVLRETAISEGMSTLKHSARRLVAQGITSISEIQRISTDELGLLEDGAVAEGEL